MNKGWSQPVWICEGLLIAITWKVVLMVSTSSQDAVYLSESTSSNLFASQFGL